MMTLEDPTHRPRTPLNVWVGLSIAVALDVPVQLVWKALMVKYADPVRGPHGWAALSVWHQAYWFLGQARTWLLVVLFLCQFIDWLYVLGNADLSFAQPFTALSYVAVSTCAVLYFHEHLTPIRVVGIGLILAGVALVGSSEAKAGKEPS